MRYRVVRALLVKEARRHAANRGGIALCLLLVVAALVVSVFDPGAGGARAGAGELGGVHRCVVQCVAPEAFTRDLESTLPPGLRDRIRFESAGGARVDGLVDFPPGTAAIRIRLRPGDPGVLEIAIWHPPGNPGAMLPYEDWVWRAARRALQAEAARRVAAKGGDPSRLTRPEIIDPPGNDLWAVRDSVRQLSQEAERLAPGAATPTLEVQRHGLGAKELDLRTTVATGMVIFSLYFFCVYLLPAMTCEERERGSLLAQALSPASTWEILTAKFLFYPLLGAALATTVALITKPEAVSTLFFWLTLAAVGAGFLGIGMTVATLARTQRAALMASMCYLMTVALVLIVCQSLNVPLVPYLAVEFHGPRAVHAAVSGDVQFHHWANLVGSGLLGVAWLGLAGVLFRRRGWQ